MEVQSRAADPRPVSDVSTGVGLAGLLGLFIWVAICRNWPALMDMIGLPGPHARLDGPYAAMCGLFFAALPMVLVSIFADKVHLRPSTGIDWKCPRSLGDALDTAITKLAGLWATWALIGFFYCIARWYWDGQYLFAMDVIGIAAVPMFLLSVPYVLWLDRRMVNPRDGCWHFGAMLIGREPCDGEEVRHHLRSWAVKGFFSAFMISIVPGGFGGVVNTDIAQVLGDPVRLSSFLIEIMFMIDVQIGTVGYLLTLKPLDAQIRSANPYMSGWVAALICYPPFVLMTDGGPLDYHPNTADWSVWFGNHELLLWGWGALLVFLTAIYAWATVIFGIRFSNLTYRGVITNGPFRFTRHPAYLSKNLFWWCATMPFFATSDSWVDVIRNTVLMALVSAVYYWRACTEERHLASEDAKYVAYHAWMSRNALITRTLDRMGRAMRPRGPQLQPAE